MEHSAWPPVREPIEKSSAEPRVATLSAATLDATEGAGRDLVAALRAGGCVYAEDEAAILMGACRTRAELEGMIAQRVAGIPLEHLVGWAEFCGLRMVVAPGVFVPRRRSEFLVRQTLTELAGHPCGERQLKILDLCTGSGAVGAALARSLPDCELHVADVDPVALACAAQNVAAFGGKVYCGDLFDPVPDSLQGSFDVIVANAPYVPTEAIAFMPREARVYEPMAALDGGADGLALHRRIAAQAPLWLGKDGILLVESSARQAETTAAILVSQGFSVSVSTSEELGGTVVAGRLSPAPVAAPGKVFIKAAKPAKRWGTG
ncbi:putative protein N(5)-glutamine methyltransferase [Arthrobacter sp.]|uniref:putative protein N(5)-glutamine methyltransferase n=1 Tax=Arthrobacter sp. TaxID=1667 RepID=UPI0026DFA4E1|nr:putative protein N(5)-glutamine methyltransferase [Arthrobacter sp.]MDO5752659.1 putative protein N(5)-glutamine methyltransferase [Arthrobacter sp.]